MSYEFTLDKKCPLCGDKLLIYSDKDGFDLYTNHKHSKANKKGFGYKVIIYIEANDEEWLDKALKDTENNEL